VSTPRPRLVRADRSRLSAIIDLEGRCFIPADRFARSTWRHLLGVADRRGSSLTLVAIEGGCVVGAVNVLLRRDGHTARIYSLAVDPAQRGRGLGSLLIRGLARRLPPAFTTLSLEVRADNHAARALYQRLGFTVHEELPGYYLDGGDGVRLRAPRVLVAGSA
jgi:ribosomal protein S18 acetylase RimI-like enzyme